MFVNYPALFLKVKDSESFTVIFPDLEGCISCGDNLNDAFKMAQDALGAYLFEYYTKPNEIPKASRIDEIKLKLDEEDKNYFLYNESFKNYVSIDLAEYVKKSSTKTVKKTLSIPSYLNEAGIENNINFSLLLQDALKKKLKLI